MAFAVLFKNAILQANVAVLKLIYLKTAGAEIEPRDIFVGAYNRCGPCGIAFAYLLAFCKVDVPRLTEAAVLDEGLTAGVVKAVYSVNVKQKGI